MKRTTSTRALLGLAIAGLVSTPVLAQSADANAAGELAAAKAAAAKAETAAAQSKAEAARATAESIALRKEVARLKKMAADAKETEAAKKAKAEAEAKLKAEAAAKEAAKKAANPWTTDLVLGVNGSLLHADKVVGQPDGLTAQAGVVVGGKADLKTGAHRWNNAFKVAESLTQTPVLPDVWVKSADQLDLSTEYIYVIEAFQWFGPYARASAQAAIFPGDTYRTAPTTVERTDRLGDVTTSNPVSPGKAIALTDWFEPLVLNENAGIAAFPFESKAFTLKSRLGFGGQHIIVRDGYTLASEENNIVKLKQLENTNTAGVNFDVDASGVLTEGIGWNLSSKLYYPLVGQLDGITNAAGDAATGADLINADIAGKIAFKVIQGVSLDYVLTLKRVPAVQADWQVQNALLLSASYDLL